MSLPMSLLLSLLPLAARAEPPLTLRHSATDYEVRLAQSAGVAAQVWHQRRLRGEGEDGLDPLGGALTEVGTPAGGCRVRLYWGEGGEGLGVGDLRPTPPPRLLWAALAPHRQARAEGAEVTLSATGALTLRAAHSAGCALPTLPNARPPARPPAPIGVAEPLWRPLALHPDAGGALTLTDEGLALRLAPSGGARATLDAAGGVQWSGPKGVTLTLSLLSAHAPLTPLPADIAAPRPAAPGAPRVCEGEGAPERCALAAALTRFLSYREGLCEGLGAGLARCGAPALTWALLAADEMPAEWVEAALAGALTGEVAWPLAPDDPIAPLDGRLALLPLLSRYSSTHPEGQARAEEFLRRKVGWRMMGSLVTEHTRGLLRRAAHFANRPAPVYLARTAPPSELLHDPQPGRQPTRPAPAARATLAENLTLTPLALGAAARLLRHPAFGALIGGQPGEADRARRLKESWERAGEPFTRVVKVQTARARAEGWWESLPTPRADSPWRHLRHDLSLLIGALPPAPSGRATLGAQARAAASLALTAPPAEEPRMSALVALNLLLGAVDEEALGRQLAHGLLAPAGLLTPWGLSWEGEALLRDPPGMPITTPAQANEAARAALDSQAGSPAAGSPVAGSPAAPATAPPAALSDERLAPTRAARWLDIVWQRALARQRERAWGQRARLAIEEAHALHWEVLRPLLARPLSEGEPFEEEVYGERLPLAPAPALTPGERLAPLSRRGWDLSAALVLLARPPAPPAPLEPVSPAELRP